MPEFLVKVDVGEAEKAFELHSDGLEVLGDLDTLLEVK